MVSFILCVTCHPQTATCLGILYVWAFPKYETFAPSPPFLDGHVPTDFLKPSLNLSSHRRMVECVFPGLPLEQTAHLLSGKDDEDDQRIGEQALQGKVEGA